MADYQSKTNTGKCIFCGIREGIIQTPGIFWENDEFMAFLSTWPSVEGFTVVIPKNHYGSDCLALPDDVLQRMVVASKEVSKILMKYFTSVGRVGLIMEGTGIDHAHIKLIPMHNTEHMRRGEWRQYLSDQERFFDSYPGYLVSYDGPKGNSDELSRLAEQLRLCV